MKLTLKALQELDATPPWDWPEDTGTDLLEVLRDHEASDEERLRAADLAGNPVVVDDELVGALLAVVRNPKEAEKVRCAAAIALGPVLEQCETDGFDDPEEAPIAERTFQEAQEALRVLFADAAVPKEVRRRILEGSVRAPLHWHEAAIRQAFESGDPEWKLTAVFCMRSFKGFDEEILASLTSDNPNIQVEAVWAAGVWSLAAAWQHVVDLVTAETTPKRLLLAAICAVGDIRPKEAREVLSHLADSEDPDIAETVLEASSMEDGGEWDEESFGDEGEEGEEEEPKDEKPRLLH